MNIYSGEADLGTLYKLDSWKVIWTFLGLFLKIDLSLLSLSPTFFTKKKEKKKESSKQKKPQQNKKNPTRSVWDQGFCWCQLGAASSSGYAGSGTDMVSPTGCPNHLAPCWEAEATGRCSGTFSHWLSFHRQSLPPPLLKDKIACSLLSLLLRQDGKTPPRLLGPLHLPGWQISCRSHKADKAAVILNVSGGYFANGNK